MDTRWGEISQKIRIDHNMGEEMKQQLWRILGNYQDIFAGTRENWAATPSVSTVSIHKGLLPAKHPQPDCPTGRRRK
jgi:hypothetical protein